jgi:hypothetical protein
MKKKEKKAGKAMPGISLGFFQVVTQGLEAETS